MTALMISGETRDSEEDREEFPNWSGSEKQLPDNMKSMKKMI